MKAQPLFLWAVVERFGRGFRTIWKLDPRTLAPTRAEAIRRYDNPVEYDSGLRTGWLKTIRVVVKTADPGDRR